MISCPICEKSDAVRCRDESKFYVNGILTAICFHGHGNGMPVVFNAESGELIKQAPVEPWQAFYRALESGEARGFGPAFLAEHCGIYKVTESAQKLAAIPFPTAKDLVDATKENATITAAPLYVGAAMVGLELRKVSISGTISGEGKWYKVIGTQGIYIANPRIQPKAIVVFEGVWDAASAQWDAYQHDSQDYAFCAIKAGTHANVLATTLYAHFPGIPILIITDQDPAGKGARARLRKVGTLAILPGTGMAKDYRDAAPGPRWDALLTGIERALERSSEDTEEGHGDRKVAGRALAGALQAKNDGLKDIEAWRFGQRVAGICATKHASRTHFSIRARVNGSLPVPEGQHPFDAVLAHPNMIRIRSDYPDLAAMIEAGPTEGTLSPEWSPPQFLPDGRHWTEIPPQDRIVYAREHGWEPWRGKDPGVYEPLDLALLHSRMRAAYTHVCIPGTPDSEVASRVLVLTLATALCGLWAEERYHAHIPTGFLPCLWIYGGPASGKGTAAKIISVATSGDPATRGSQRFDGCVDGWLTESFYHFPIVFRDELDQFMDFGHVEDLKVLLAGESLQVRKKFGTDHTVWPRPVVFSSNKLRIREDDDALKERIIVLNLEPLESSKKEDRNKSFHRFYDWMQTDGIMLINRIGIGLYRKFRALTDFAPKWTRSACFDQAVGLVASEIGEDGASILAPLLSAKTELMAHSTPWFAGLIEYAKHELSGALSPIHEVLASVVWGCNSGADSEQRKLRRRIDEMNTTIQAASPHEVAIPGFRVEMGCPAASTKRTIIFTRT